VSHAKVNEISALYRLVLASISFRIC
jgi:hypothetical protein